MARNSLSPVCAAGCAKTGAAANKAVAPAKAIKRIGLPRRRRSGADRIFVVVGQEEDAQDDGDDDRQRQEESAPDLVAADRLALRSDLGASRRGRLRRRHGGGGGHRSGGNGREDRIDSHLLFLLLQLRTAASPASRQAGARGETANRPSGVP